MYRAAFLTPGTLRHLHLLHNTLDKQRGTSVLQ